MAGVTLTEQMGAMALVDDLRHRQRVVQEHLNLPERREEVARRIREYYQSNNIAVDEALVDQGVREFFTRRLVFEAPPLSGGAVLFARLYISRGRWVKPLVLSVLVLLGLAGVAYKSLDVVADGKQQGMARLTLLEEQRQALTSRFDAMSLSTAEHQQVQALLAAMHTALQAGNAKLAEKKLAALSQTLAYAETPLVLNLVDRTGVKSGVERNYDASGGKSWYLIVEASDPAGSPVAVPVTSAETGARADAVIFGIRVTQEEYQRVKADKISDGRIDDRLVGQKPANSLTIQFNARTTARPDMILDW